MPSSSSPPGRSLPLHRAHMHAPSFVGALCLLLFTFAATSYAQRYPIVPDSSLDTLLLPQNFSSKQLQTRLLADLGNDLDGIQLLIKFGPSLGEGFVDFPNSSALGKLGTDPGLSYLATAVQAYLALYGGISIVSSDAIKPSAPPPNFWLHGATAYQPGAPLPNQYNGGTLYSLFYYSLRGGPVLITTPEYNGTNIWTIVLHDAYGANYKVLSSYNGGNAGGKYLLVPPTWDGPTPAGVTLIRSATVEGLALGRTFINPSPQSAIKFNLAWTGGVWGTPTVAPLPPSTWPFAYPESSGASGNYINPTDPLLFWRVAGEVLRRNGAPHVTDPLARLLPSIGLYSDYGFVQAGLDPLVPAALALAPYYANRILVARYTFLGPPELNYWLRPENNGAFGTDYAQLAAIQKGFWVANKLHDAAYHYQYLDGSGTPLNGTLSDYTIDFPAPPPIGNGSFWSLQTGNLDHWTFPLGPGLTPPTASTAPGFYTKPDGSVSFRLSTSPPPANSTAQQRGWNHVAIPPAHFHLILRVYVPQLSALQNTYAPPPVVQVAQRRR